jgi:hypothetical protein
MNPSDRRRTQRLPVGDNRARLLWESGPDVLDAPVQLVEVSGEGLSFFAESPPPAGSDVCFRLEAPRRSGWVLAHVVRSDGASGGALSFARYCPSDLMAAIA